MFSADNIELDFDDDFSSNIFCKKVTADRGDAVERGRVCEKIKSNQNNLKRGLSQSPDQLLKEEHKPDTRTSSSSAFNFPPTTTLKENPPKRPHLQDEKPQKKPISHETLLPRKFPGPAGLLPDKPFKQISELQLPLEQSGDEEESSSEKENPIVYSQSSGSVFLESAYQKLMADFNLNDSSNLLNKYTVEWVKRTALSKGLQGRKIPFLGLVVHAVNHSMPDPMLILRDPTGEMSGSLHREVWTEMGGKLRAGIALALRQVGVLITGVIRRQIYLNITMNNILAIYVPSENEREVEITTVNKVSRSELAKNLASRAAPRWNLPSAREEDARGVVGGKGEGREGLLSDLGIVLRDGDFSEEMRVPEGEEQRRTGSGGRVGISSQALSPAESLIFEEVLSGINLDEFDM